MKTTTLLDQLTALIAKIERIVPADLDGDALAQRNGEYVCLDDVLDAVREAAGPVLDGLMPHETAASESQGESEQGALVPLPDAAAVVVGSPALTPPPESRREAEHRLGFDPTNHHNALTCPYCNPDRLTLAQLREAAFQALTPPPSSLLDELDALQREIGNCGQAGYKMLLGWADRLHRLAQVAAAERGGAPLGAVPSLTRAAIVRAVKDIRAASDLVTAVDLAIAHFVTLAAEDIRRTSLERRIDAFQEAARRLAALASQEGP